MSGHLKAVSSYWLLWCDMNIAIQNICSLISILLAVYLGVEFLDHEVIQFVLFLRNHHTLYHFYIYILITRVPVIHVSVISCITEKKEKI